MITPSFGLTATERVLPRLALDWTTGVAQSGVDVVRAGVATFVGSNGLIQSATADTQRIDYSTGTAGLLVEESRTNLIIQSQGFTSVPWIRSNVSAVSSTVDSPSGDLTAWRVTTTSAIGTSALAQSVTTTIDTEYSFTIFGKYTDTQFIRIRFLTGTAFNPFVWFDIQNGVVGTVQAGLTASISLAPNGYYRCSVKITAISISTTLNITFTTNDNTGPNAIGLSMDLWGAQMEAGAFPTSYIPTVTATVTRNADVPTMTGTNLSDWFNTGEGTFFIQSNARNGNDLLTAGSYVLTADATALKKYATTYGADPSATQLNIGKGTHQKIMYYPQELIAAELAALTA